MQDDFASWRKGIFVRGYIFKGAYINNGVYNKNNIMTARS